MPLDAFVLVDEQHTLGTALAELDEAAVIGVDVERADWDRYWRTAALIQVGSAGRVVLVDPLKVEDLSALDAFLDGRVTVLHAMSNDLGPLASAGVRPERVEDTAVAAELLGLPTGLETLLTELLGVTLAADKASMQRAEWEERPLRPEMLEYAAADVADLPALWAELRRRLVAAGRLGWYHEQRDAVRHQPEIEERRTWTNLRGIGRLEPAARGRVRALWETREHLAREHDTAPGRIVSDGTLVDLAVKPASRASELGRRGVRRQSVRRFGTALVSSLNDARAEAPAPLAPASTASDPRGRQLTREDRQAADVLRALRAARAQALGLDPGVLCPNRILLPTVLSDPATPAQLRAALDLRDWQWRIVGYDFCEALGLDTAGMTPPDPLPDADDPSEDPPDAAPEATPDAAADNEEDETDG